LSWFKHDVDAITLKIYVQPGAKQNEIVGLHGEALKIRLSARSIDGRANDALIKYLALLFKIPLRQVAIVQGEKSRHKTVVIVRSNMEPEQVFSLKRAS